MTDHIKQAYRLLGHATGIKPGDQVRVNQNIQADNSNIPPGCNLRYKPGSTPYGIVAVRGIDANGNVVVNWLNRNVALPNTFVTRLANSAAIPLNSNYVANLDVSKKEFTAGGHRVKLATLERIAKRMDEPGRGIKTASVDYRTARITRQRVQVGCQTFTKTQITTALKTMKQRIKEAAKPDNTIQRIATTGIVPKASYVAPKPAAKKSTRR